MKKIISVLVSICIIGNTTITSFAKDFYDADDIKLNMSKAELGDKWKELEFEIKTLQTVRKPHSFRCGSVSLL